MRGKSKKPKKTVADNELVPVEALEGIVKYDEDAFNAITQSGKFLPRLQLMTSASEKCKDNEFPANNWALIRGKDFHDLGSAVDILPIAWRPKALDLGENIISSYDPESAEFQQIKERSFQKDSHCMFGPEYLIYIPSVQEWATYFMGSATARNEASNLRARINKGATLKSQKCKNKSHTWWGPMITACSTPFEVPAIEEIKEQVEKFNNPATSETVRDTDDADGEGRER